MKRVKTSKKEELDKDTSMILPHLSVFVCEKKTFV